MGCRSPGRCRGATHTVSFPEYHRDPFHDIYTALIQHMYLVGVWEAEMATSTWHCQVKTRYDFLVSIKFKLNLQLFSQMLLFYYYFFTQTIVKVYDVFLWEKYLTNKVLLEACLEKIRRISHTEAFSKIPQRARPVIVTVFMVLFYDCGKPLKSLWVVLHYIVHGLNYTAVHWC